MSQLNAKTLMLGQNADQSKNFKIVVPTPEDGTLTIERANGTDVMKFLAAGGVEMPSLPFSKTANGYVTLPNGLIIQWITVPGAASDNPFSFSIPFPNALFCAVATPFSLQGAGSVALAVSFGTLSNSGGTVQPRYIDASQVIPSSAAIKVIAIGY